MFTFKALRRKERREEVKENRLRDKKREKCCRKQEERWENMGVCYKIKNSSLLILGFFTNGFTNE